MLGEIVEPTPTTVVEMQVEVECDHKEEEEVKMDDVPTPSEEPVTPEKVIEPEQ